MCSRAQPRRGKAVRANWQQLRRLERPLLNPPLDGQPLKPLLDRPLRRFLLDRPRRFPLERPLRRRPTPAVLPLRAPLRARPCQCERVEDTMAVAAWLGCARFAIGGHAAGTHLRARALDRRRHGAEYPRALCACRAALRGGKAAHCARRCAQGSRSAHTTPTTARRASRISSRRRRV
jgi:hypothetical protein